MARIAVLASGQGTNLQALLDDAVVGEMVAVVVTDRPGAPALARASARGVPTEVLESKGFESRDAYDEALAALIKARGADLVVLAGFMRVLGPAIIGRFEGRMLNVHPSLLPAFPGAHAVADALAWGIKMTGVTVHLVDGEVDHGPIVAQEGVPIAGGEDQASVEARIHEVEHRLLPRAVRALAQGRVKVQGRQVLIIEEAE